MRALATPQAPRPRAGGAEALWFEWLGLAGLLAFATWLLGAKGVWTLLLHADPTGITLVIIVVFSGATLWCGARTRELERQRGAIDGRASRSGGQGTEERAGVSRSGHWGADYLSALARTDADAGIALDLLVERTHGPHATAWWVCGIQLKLGLLGKVIGFSILALTIGDVQSFDPAQSQELLRSLTTGLGVALLTTMVGLVGNILLGLQLTRLDRYADAFVAELQRRGLEARAGAA